MKGMSSGNQKNGIIGFLIIAIPSLFLLPGVSVSLGGEDLHNQRDSVWYVSPQGDDQSGDGSTASPFATIQHTIDTAGSGEAIALAEGTYTGDGNRDLDFLGKNLYLYSLSDDPLNTIIDCAGTEAEPHFGFWFHSGEDTTSILRGITVTGAHVAPPAFGAIMVGPGEDYYGTPGYIGAHLKMENCHVTGNHGTGIEAAYRHNNAVHLDGCQVSFNTGTGFSCHSEIGGSSRVVNCLFEDNGGDGATLSWYTDGGPNLFGPVTNCRFRRNGWSGVSFNSTYTSYVEFENCEFLENMGYGVWGNDHLFLHNCLVQGNQGGGVAMDGLAEGYSISLTGSEILDNVGTGVYSNNRSVIHVNISDVVIARNTGAGFVGLNPYGGGFQFSQAVIMDNGGIGLDVSGSLLDPGGGISISQNSN